MIDLEVVHIEETDSTNRWMKENGSQKDMVVVAEYQTAGKGCGSNSWESERGKNLLCSAIIHPKDFQAKSQFIITQLVSVSLCRAVERFVNRPVEIKWPNDIYVGDKKICGVLIENRLQGHMVKDTIIGVGLNVNQTERDERVLQNQKMHCRIQGETIQARGKAQVYEAEHRF